MHSEQYYHHLPFSAHKKSLSLCCHPPDGPRTSTICCPAINWAFINKYQLTGLVLTYSSDIIETFFSRAFCCNTGHLQGSSWHNLDFTKQKRLRDAYLFHCKLSFTKHSPYCWLWNILATHYGQHFLKLIQIHVWVLTDSPKDKLDIVSS